MTTQNAQANPETAAKTRKKKDKVEKATTLKRRLVKFRKDLRERKKIIAGEVLLNLLENPLFQKQRPEVFKSWMQVIDKHLTNLKNTTSTDRKLFDLPPLSQETISFMKKQAAEKKNDKAKS